MVSSCVMFIQSSHCFWLWFQFLLDEWKQTPIYSPAPVCIAKKSWQCSFFLHLFWVTSIWLYRLCLVDFIAFQARSNFSIPNQHISDTLPLDVQSKDSNQFFRLGRVLRNDWSPNSEIQCTCKHWRNWWTVTSASFTFHSPAPQQSTRKYQRPQTSCWTRHIYNIAMSLSHFCIDGAFRIAHWSTKYVSSQTFQITLVGSEQKGINKDGKLRMYHSFDAAMWLDLCPPAGIPVFQIPGQCKFPWSFLLEQTNGRNVGKKRGKVHCCNQMKARVMYGFHVI